MTFADVRLNISGASVSRGDRIIVDDFSLSVKSKDLVWLRGTNGVGKTSLLRIAAGLARPDTGEITRTFGGAAVTAPQITAFQGHRDAVKPSLSVYENLVFWARLSGRSETVDRALLKVGLTGREGQKAGTLSAGQIRRLALAQLWVSQKPLWIMDEPAAAIDLSGQAVIDDLIAEHIAGGGAIILASHAAPPQRAGIRFVTLHAPEEARL